MNFYHHELENGVRFKARKVWMMNILNTARNFGHYSKIAFELANKMILREKIKISN
ncbi:MAG: hypothetical protein ACFFAK_10040 [Promethearchaeota archaeon]